MSLTESFAMEIQKHFIKKYLPILAKAAAETVDAGGIEGKDMDETCEIFNNVFDKVMSGDLVIQKKGGKKKIAKKKKKSDKKENESDDEEQPKEKKSAPKAKKTPVPKQLWVDFEESKTMRQENKMYCSYVADKGKNKGKFCGTILTEEHKNCGNFDEEGNWEPHKPEDELNTVEGNCRSMRCKKCWTKGKDNNYRKIGAYDKMYLEEENQQNQQNQEDYGGETETENNEETENYAPEYDDETQANISDQETQDVTDEDRE